MVSPVSSDQGCAPGTKTNNSSPARVEPTAFGGISVSEIYGCHLQTLNSDVLATTAAFMEQRRSVRDS